MEEAAERWVDQDRLEGEVRKLYLIHNRNSPRPVDDQVDLTTSQNPTTTNLCQGDLDGSALDNIYIIRLINRGQFGSVYEGHQITTDGAENSICVKFMRLSSITNPGEHERAVARAMRNETAMYKVMRSPPSVISRVQFLAMTADDDGFKEFCIGMDYISDLDLLKGIEREIVNEYHLYDILWQLSEANIYLKDHCIHHLDIKPNNIIYKAKPGSKSGKLKLIDFGSAKRIADLSAGALKLETQPSGLTQCYAAPEVLLSERQLSGSSCNDGDIYYLHETTDLYSIGATAYHVIWSDVPWNKFGGMTLFMAGTSFMNVWRDETNRSNLQKDLDVWDHPLKRIIQGLLEVKYTQRMDQDSLIRELQDIQPIITQYEKDLEKNMALSNNGLSRSSESPRSSGYSSTSISSGRRATRSRIRTGTRSTSSSRVSQLSNENLGVLHMPVSYDDAQISPLRGPDSSGGGVVPATSTLGSSAGSLHNVEDINDIGMANNAESCLSIANDSSERIGVIPSEILVDPTDNSDYADEIPLALTETELPSTIEEEGLNPPDPQFAALPAGVLSMPSDEPRDAGGLEAAFKQPSANTVSSTNQSHYPTQHLGLTINHDEYSTNNPSSSVEMIPTAGVSSEPTSIADQLQLRTTTPHSPSNILDDDSYFNKKVNSPKSSRPRGARPGSNHESQLDLDTISATGELWHEDLSSDDNDLPIPPPPRSTLQSAAIPNIPPPHHYIATPQFDPVLNVAAVGSGDGGSGEDSSDSDDEEGLNQPLCDGDQDDSGNGDDDHKPEEGGGSSGDGNGGRNGTNGGGTPPLGGQGGGGDNGDRNGDGGDKRHNGKVHSADNNEYSTDDDDDENEDNEYVNDNDEQPITDIDNLTRNKRMRFEHGNLTSASPATSSPLPVTSSAPPVTSLALAVTSSASPVTSLASPAASSLPVTSSPDVTADSESCEEDPDNPKEWTSQLSQNQLCSSNDDVQISPLRGPDSSGSGVVPATSTVGSSAGSLHNVEDMNDIGMASNAGSFPTIANDSSEKIGERPSEILVDLTDNSDYADEIPLALTETKLPSTIEEGLNPPDPQFAALPAGVLSMPSDEPRDASGLEAAFKQPSANADSTDQSHYPAQHLGVTINHDKYLTKNPSFSVEMIPTAGPSTQPFSMAEQPQLQTTTPHSGSNILQDDGSYCNNNVNPPKSRPRGARPGSNHESQLDLDTISATGELWREDLSSDDNDLPIPPPPRNTLQSAASPNIPPPYHYVATPQFDPVLSVAAAGSGDGGSGEDSSDSDDEEGLNQPPFCDRDQDDPKNGDGDDDRKPEQGGGSSGNGNGGCNGTNGSGTPPSGGQGGSGNNGDRNGDSGYKHHNGKVHSADNNEYSTDDEDDENGDDKYVNDSDLQNITDIANPTKNKRVRFRHGDFLSASPATSLPSPVTSSASPVTSLRSAVTSSASSVTSLASPAASSTSPVTSSPDVTADSKSGEEGPDKPEEWTSQLSQNQEQDEILWMYNRVKVLNSRVSIPFDSTDSQSPSSDLIPSCSNGIRDTKYTHIFIEEFLARGGYGNGFKATLTTDGVAGIEIFVKVQRINTHKSDEAMNNEVKTYQKLAERSSVSEHHLRQCEQTCSLLFVGSYFKSELLRCIGMPLLSKTNMADCMKGEPRTIWSLHLLNVLEQLGTALKFLHGHNIYHMDIKPKNIVVKVVKDLPICQLKLVDFGSALDISQCQDGQQELVKKPVGTTEPYCAPEVWYKRDELTDHGKPLYCISPTSDLYCVGTTAYHLVLNKIPWDFNRGELVNMLTSCGVNTTRPYIGSNSRLSGLSSHDLGRGFSCMQKARSDQYKQACSQMSNDSAEPHQTFLQLGINNWKPDNVELHGGEEVVSILRKIVNRLLIVPFENRLSLEDMLNELEQAKEAARRMQENKNDVPDQNVEPTSRKPETRSIMPGSPGLQAIGSRRIRPSTRSPVVPQRISSDEYSTLSTHFDNFTLRQAETKKNTVELETILSQESSEMRNIRQDQNTVEQQLQSIRLLLHSPQ